MERRLSKADWAAIGVALVLPTVVTWLYFIALDGAPAAAQQGAYSVGKAIQFALPIVWVWFVQRQRPRFVPPGRAGLLVGGLFGLAVGGAMIVLYFAAFKPAGAFEGPAAAVRAKVQSFGAGSPLAYAALGLFYSAIHSLLEEYYWRWFAFGQLARGCKLPWAIAISAVAFSAHHVLVLAHYFGWAAPLTWLFVASVAIGGAVWAWLYWQTRSLYACWLSHALVDAAIFLVGYDIIR
jgi:membrane protease YdiL (CAAX protease family)